jgi:hypothetical protein
VAARDVTLGIMRADQPIQQELSPEVSVALLMFRPDRGQEDMLIRLQRLSAQCDAGALTALLLRERLAVAGLDRLRGMGGGELAERLEPGLGPTIASAHSLASIQQVLTQHILAELEDRDCPAVGLKGPLMSQRLFGDAAARQSTDIDLLVDPAKLDSAVRIVCERFGYIPPLDAVDADGRPLLHFHLAHPRGWPSVEIHWRVHWYEGRSGREMVGRSALDPGGIRRLAPADEMACLLLFYARNGFVGLRDLSAIGACWERSAGGSERAGVEQLLATSPELRRCVTASARVADRLLGTPLSGVWGWRTRRLMRRGPR